MTLRELINSVDEEHYSDSPLFQKLISTKPEYGASRHIQVAEAGGNIIVSGVHVGSLGDILTYSIDVAPELNITKVQLLDAILKHKAEQPRRLPRFLLCHHRVPKAAPVDRVPCTMPCQMPSTQPSEY